MKFCSFLFGCLFISTVIASSGLAANYALWTKSSLSKVLKDDTPQSQTPVNITAAKNEHEAFQIVIRNGRKPLIGLRITKHDLVRVDGQGRISGSNVKVFQQSYIYLPKQGVYYPDPLPPFKGKIDLAPGQIQPLWIDIYVPANTPAGRYEGKITIRSDNGEHSVVNYNLRVFNFILPAESKLTTAFGLFMGDVAAKHEIKEGSQEFDKLFRNYYDFLLARGISSFNLPVDLLSPEADRYLKDERLTSFVVPYTEDVVKQKQYLDKVRVSGVWDKHFFYFVDEPVNEESYKKLKEGSKYLRGLDPKVNIVSPYYRNPDFTNDKTIYDLLSGYINIWCFNTVFYDEREIDARRKAGDVIWSYVCCGPGKPYANFFVEYTPMEHRMLMWQNYFYRISGLLYWSTTYWCETPDPWENVATWGGLYGDGSLLYPGKKVGIDGPVSSVRLEVIRDGLEDYKYLWLLEQKIGRDKVMPYVSKLVSSWTQYSRDPSELEQVRNDIAQEIEKL